MRRRRSATTVAQVAARKRSDSERAYRRDEKVEIDRVKLVRRVLEMRIVIGRVGEICDELAEALDSGELKGRG